MWQGTNAADLIFDHRMNSAPTFIVFGGGGDDVILGSDSNNYLDGGAGADTLHGGAGWNMLTGGTGRDTFVIDWIAEPWNVLNDKGAIITDFTSDADKLGFGAGMTHVSYAAKGGDVYVLAVNAQTGAVAFALLKGDPNNIRLLIDGGLSIDGDLNDVTRSVWDGNYTAAGTASQDFIVQFAGDGAGSMHTDFRGNGGDDVLITAAGRHAVWGRRQRHHVWWRWR